jgi:hypothetical protein
MAQLTQDDSRSRRGFARPIVSDVEPCQECGIFIPVVARQGELVCDTCKAGALKEVRRISDK